MFTFRLLNGGIDTFGPYASQDEAKEAFQRHHGHWPNDAILTEEY